MGNNPLAPLPTGRQALLRGNNKVYIFIILEIEESV